MINKISLDKVSELEWYLTMMAYQNMKGAKNKSLHTEGTKETQSLDFATIDAFHKFYEELKPPMVWDNSGKIGFFCPFNDTVVLLPNETFEVPVGFSVTGDFAWEQPHPDKLLYKSKVIGGKVIV